jgi:ribosomal protein S18 acetylase RimI-like enzyme
MKPVIEPRVGSDPPRRVAGLRLLRSAHGRSWVKVDAQTDRRHEPLVRHDDTFLDGRSAAYGNGVHVALTIDIRSAHSESEQQAVIAVITLAFSSDPMTRWAFPDPATYLTVMPQMARAFGGNGFAHGAAHLAAGGTAAAMWLPPGVDADSEGLAALAERHTPKEQRADMERVFAQMETYHPSEPCWYLPLIGVDPHCQGRGYGSALLRHALEQCDRDGTAAYLESSNPRNIQLYQRHGFESIGTIQAGTSPTVVPMLRPRR